MDGDMPTPVAALEMPHADVVFAGSCLLTQSPAMHT